MTNKRMEAGGRLRKKIKTWYGAETKRGSSKKNLGHEFGSVQTAKKSLGKARRRVSRK